MKIMFLLVIFVIIVYVYTYIKHRKMRDKTRKLNTVNEFRKRYQRYQQNDKKKPGTNREEENYTKYMTKYNSSIDFVDKEEFLKEALEERDKTL